MLAAVGASMVLIALFLPHWSGPPVNNERGTDDLFIVAIFGLPSIVSAALAWSCWLRQRGLVAPIAVLGALGTGITLLALSSDMGGTPQIGAWMTAVGFGMQLVGGVWLLVAKHSRAAGRLLSIGDWL